MKYPINICRYSNSMGTAPNALSTSGEISGAVVEMDGGYGCLQSWPELGDSSLESHLTALRDGQPTRLGSACLLSCQLDSAARKSGVSLFSKLVIPQSHYLFSGLPSAGRFEEQLAFAKSRGIAKIKGSPELESTLQAVEKICQVARLRIDFNSSLDCAGFENFARSLSSQARDQIEFIEDPVPYDASTWECLTASSGLTLALDWGPFDAEHGFGVRIWKPARQLNPPPGKQYCITHNMDHGIGRRYAAYRAATFSGQVLECGLDTGELRDNETGLGLDEELAAMHWESL
jgi:O-succinylbenzoate synthase